MSRFSRIWAQVILIGKPNVSRQVTKDKEACKNMFTFISNQISKD